MAFSLNKCQVDATAPLSIGQYVRWSYQDDSVPTGLVGIVAAFTDERACVKFRTGAFLIKTFELTNAPLVWADLPEDDWSFMEDDEQSGAASNAELHQHWWEADENTWPTLGKDELPQLLQQATEKDAAPECCVPEEATETVKRSVTLTMDAAAEVYEPSWMSRKILNSQLRSQSESSEEEAHGLLALGCRRAIAADQVEQERRTLALRAQRGHLAGGMRWSKPQHATHARVCTKAGAAKEFQLSSMTEAVRLDAPSASPVRRMLPPRRRPTRFVPAMAKLDPCFCLLHILCLQEVIMLLPLDTALAKYVAAGVAYIITFWFSKLLGWMLPESIHSQWCRELTCLSLGIALAATVGSTIAADVAAVLYCCGPRCIMIWPHPQLVDMLAATAASASVPRAQEADIGTAAANELSDYQLVPSGAAGSPEQAVHGKNEPTDVSMQCQPCLPEGSAAESAENYDDAAAELLPTPLPSADAWAQRGRSGKPQEAVGLPSRAQFCHAFMRRRPCGNSDCDVPRLTPSPQPGNAEPETDDDTYNEPFYASFFEVRALPRDKRPLITEQDAVKDACSSLAQRLRPRPTLPPKPDDSSAPWEDVFSAVRLPLWHCAFQGCRWCGDGMEELRQHLGASHCEDFARCRALTPHARRYEDVDLYEEAIAIKEREQFPLVGPSVDRRTIELLLTSYNDHSVRSLVCFVCGQTKTQTQGNNADIGPQSAGWLASLPIETLEANIGWEKWFERFGSTEPLVRYGPGQHVDNPRRDWCIRLRFYGAHTSIDLFGCPEDWSCGAPLEPPLREGCDETEQRRRQHCESRADDVPTLCEHCILPVCRACRVQLASAGGRSNVPMALANDNWYGYVQDVIARYDARWIECACASLCWTTLITYQLEEPYGHLMNESMQGSRSRTAARGNVFSFMMPWEDILQNLKKAESEGTRVALPHDGAVLAVLLRVHIVGGSLDVTKHLRDVHLRVGVVRCMLEELIERGFPGYKDYNVEEVRRRTKELYGEDDRAELVPVEIREEVERARASARNRQRDEPWDKNATPAEPPADDAGLAFQAARPFEIVAERSSDAGIDVNAAHANALERYGNLAIQTGSSMLDQWKAEYLCTSNPFTLALPVGGYDVAGSEKWRRAHEDAFVTLADLVAGLPRRIEGQFRRHWVFAPLLWNLWFRERVLRSRSLAIRCIPKASEPMEVAEEEATLAAARCYQRLHSGTYTGPQGVQRPIRGDTSKSLFADGTSSRQRAMLQNMHFISAALPGTQEARRQMGHVGTGFNFVYGSGIFMTVSPSERHNGLAIRLSRYRRNDPLLDPSVAAAESKWIGAEEPRIRPQQGGEAASEATVIDMPDYDLRRVILARDPLCTVEAFKVLVRVVLAHLLGIRMCPDCPHCNKGKNPCQNRFGSNALPQGGIFGRCDGVFGGVETQKSGSLHLHFWAYVQRAHQHKTLLEIAELIKQGLLAPGGLKAYHAWISNAMYPNLPQVECQVEEMEQNWPTFKSDTELGRIPDFLWEGGAPHLLEEGATEESLRHEGAKWFRQYEDAAQHRMLRVGALAPRVRCCAVGASFALPWQRCFVCVRIQTISPWLHIVESARLHRHLF